MMVLVCLQESKTNGSTRHLYDHFHRPAYQLCAEPSLSCRRDWLVRLAEWEKCVALQATVVKEASVDEKPVEKKLK